jgi:hypothetical protein
LSQIVGAGLRGSYLTGDLEDRLFIKGLEGHGLFLGNTNPASLLLNARVGDKWPDWAVQIGCFFQSSPSVADFPDISARSHDLA